MPNTWSKMGEIKKNFEKTRKKTAFSEMASQRPKYAKNS